MRFEHGFCALETKKSSETTTIQPNGQLAKLELTLPGRVATKKFY